MKTARFDEEKKKWVQTIPHKNFYKISELQVILYMTYPSIYNAIKRGRLPAFKVEGMNVVKHEDLIAYIERKTRIQNREVDVYISD